MRLNLLKPVSAGLIAALLSGCVITTGPLPQGGGASATSSSAPIPSSRAVNRFRAVVARVEPVAESVCRQRRPGLNCDFRIVVDKDRSLPPNAYQTRDGNGRPVIGFTQALIADARNADELAFILGHEAGHHIRDHLPRRQSAANTGAALGGIVAAVFGADSGGVQQAANLGGLVGSRRFSPGYELEADRVGTRIAIRAGYDPVRGAAYFTRIADPGNGFLASHPPNSSRIDTVRATAREFRR
ncbi:M48 family metallopeptidase [Oceanibium sediminis]|uniref:M48 family metallopeptidase n=1 Tax=Oceanibium sediminis TaxID=2026339 RepID=UPI0018E52251|nr:M48 family metallopeptidase [Oceanibium sediminis]